MPEANKPGEKLPDRAREAAEQAAKAAGPALDRAREVAGDLVEKAAPYLDKAADLATQGVSAAAEQIDKVTGGKYTDKISAVSAKIEDNLDRKPPPS